MGKGYWGKILRVELSSGKVSVDEHDDKFYRTYLGGRGIISHYLMKEVPADCDPLGPDNVLVFAASVLTGIAVPGTARSSVGAKSPLTGGYGEGEGGGHWGAKLRWAGYDGIVITGRAEKPVYLWINNDTVELRDASRVWGMEAYETQEAVRAEVKDNEATVAVIGPGGERLIRFACIGLGLHNYVGRSGLGAVMGAKRLKAVAVNGKTRPEVADKEQVSSIARKMSDISKNALMAKMGTSILVRSLNESGGLPTRNFREGSFEGYETLSGQHMAMVITKKKWGCYACPVRCKQIVEVAEAKMTVSQHYGGPEYETIGSFGSNCGIDDIKAVAKANEICNQNSLDTISAGMMISGAMECAEKGLLPEDLTKGLDLRFGSIDGMLDLLNLIVKREGLGDILAEGPTGAIDKLGKETASCFLHVKNQPLPLHEPRFKAGLGVGYGLSPTGADHMHNIHDSAYTSEAAPTFAGARNMGILEAVDAAALGSAKARLWTYMTLNRSISNSALLCFFTPYNMDLTEDLTKAVTGWNVSSFELIKSAERALNIARAFNALAGFTAEDDILPDRFFEPLKGGALKGNKIDRREFLATRGLIYDMLGWDREKAAPKQWKLYELGLGWVAAKLEKRGTTG